MSKQKNNHKYKRVYSNAYTILNKNTIPLRIKTKTYNYIREKKEKIMISFF